MDYMKFVKYHREMHADITIGCIPNGPERAKEFGLLKMDDNRRVVVRVALLPWACTPLPWVQPTKLHGLVLAAA